MKKIMALLLSVVMLGSMASTAVSAAETGETSTGASVIGYYLDGTQTEGKYNGTAWNPQAMIDDANG